MIIRHLQIETLRVIRRANVHLSSGLNLFIGNNGAGKTTLLEAVYLLGQGRSFRHIDAGPLIQKGSEAAQVIGRLESERGSRSTLGVRREKHKLFARSDGREIKRRSELVRRLPVFFIGAPSHDLVERGPELRRQFLDLGLFHVEPRYHSLLSDYARALRQRNAALKQGDYKLAESFSDLLGNAGESITQRRVDFLAQLSGFVQEMLKHFQANFQVELHYRPGWKDERGSLRWAIEQQMERDLHRGYTSVGPHRAELQVLTPEGPASRILSRGQQKLLVYALIMGLLQSYLEKTEEPPVLLLDDLAAELDERRTVAVLDWVEEKGIQVLVTALEAGKLESRFDKVFHVEHGWIRESGPAA